MAVVEVETGESVNHLEALAQWANLAKLRAPFHLYVPSGMIDVARRLCEDNQIHVSEVWSYHTVAEDVRFTLVHRSRETAHPGSSGRARPKPSAATKRSQSTRTARRPARPRPAKKTKRK